MSTVEKLSRTQIVEKIKSSKDQFFSVRFKKNEDGSVVTRMGQVRQDSFMTNLGYIILRLGEGQIRNVDPKNIIEVKINKITYKRK